MPVNSECIVRESYLVALLPSGSNIQMILVLGETAKHLQWVPSERARTNAVELVPLST